MTNRKNIFPRRLLIEADGKLSHAAARLGLRICSYIYNHKEHRFAPDEPFPLPWTVASKLMFGMDERQIYRLFRELHDQGHIVHCGVFGCPGKAHYKIICDPGHHEKEWLATNPDATASTDKNVSPSTDKNVRARSVNCDSPSPAKNDGARTDKKGRPLTKYSLREETFNPKEEIRGGSAAQGTKGKQQPPAAEDAERLRRAAEQHFRNWRKKGS